MLASIMAIDSPHYEGKSVPDSDHSKEYDDDVQQAHQTSNSFHFNNTHDFLSFYPLSQGGIFIYLLRDLRVKHSMKPTNKDVQSSLIGSKNA